MKEVLDKENCSRKIYLSKGEKETLKNAYEIVKKIKEGKKDDDVEVMFLDFDYAVGRVILDNTMDLTCLTLYEMAEGNYIESFLYKDEEE